MTRAEVASYLDEIARDGWPVSEIGFTGGEPFMNPDIIEMLGDALARGHSALMLTNAMQPMLRPRIREGLLGLRETYGERLVMRVSLDHYARALHDTERGEGSFAKTIEGIDWLAREDFALALAGRTCWGESEQRRAGRLRGADCGASLAGRCIRSCPTRAVPRDGFARRGARDHRMPAGASWGSTRRR